MISKISGLFLRESPNMSAMPSYQFTTPVPEIAGLTVGRAYKSNFSINITLEMVSDKRYPLITGSLSHRFGWSSEPVSNLRPVLRNHQLYGPLSYFLR